MFDLITESIERPLRETSLGSRIISIVGHVVVLLMVVVLPVLFAADALPPVPPVMMAFVAAASAPPPPPPPPPPAPRAATPAAARPAQTTNQFAAPIEAPTEIRPEPAVPSARALDGVEGGLEGGVPGGIVGGIVGDIVSPPPPPPPPPPPQPRAPVRIGGNISAPQLLRRVEPEYPDLAVSAHVHGMVIIEAVVNPQGCVESVKVLRSPHRLLERAAVNALTQWQYSPLILNGSPVPFVLTVTFTFSAGS